MSKQVNLRATHRTLFWMAMSFAIGSICFGLNFLIATPTFNPFGIDYRIIGGIFIVLGASKLTALVLIRNLRLIRIAMASCSVYMLFWGVGTSITFFQGKTSLQLFVAFTLLAVIQWLLLREPYLNPATASDGDSE